MTSKSSLNNSDIKDDSYSSIPSYVIVIPNKLLFGDKTVANDANLIEQLGITSIINLTNTPSVYPKISYDYPVLDKPSVGTSWMAPCMDHIEKELGLLKIVYVHCSAGISRSPSLIIHYLMSFECMTLRQAYTHLLKERSIIQPSIGFIKGLIEYEKTLYELQSIMQCFMPRNIRDSSSMPEQKDIEEFKPSMTEQEYIMIVLSQRFPRLEFKKINAVYYDIYNNKKYDTDLRVVGKKDIHPFGFLVMDELMVMYPTYYMACSDRSLHHPFD